MGEGKYWDEAISKLLGEKIQVETLDGMYLDGKLSKVQIKGIIIEGELVRVPLSLELDNDSEKVIDVSRLKEIIRR